jgi:hypothetical protein
MEVVMDYQFLNEAHYEQIFKDVSLEAPYPNTSISNPVRYAKLQLG